MSTYYCNACCEQHESLTSACPRTNEQPAKPSPAWAWVTLSADLTRGTLDDGIVHAYATVLLDHALVTIRAEGNTMQMSTMLPAWSQAQQRRWVEQWVASQADAAVAAFEAAEGMR